MIFACNVNGHHSCAVAGCLLLIAVIHKQGFLAASLLVLYCCCSGTCTAITVAMCVQMLDEIQAGIFDGWTYEQIEQQMPQEFVARKKDKLKYRCAFASVYPVIVAFPVCMCSCSFSACLWLMAYF